MLNTTARNLMLDALAAATHASLHGAWSGTGANELSGGSPAYARQALAWAAAASDSKSITGTETFDVPPGATVAFVGLFSALSAGTHYGMFPAGSTGYKRFQTDQTANTILCEAHGFANGDRVVFLGPTAPGGLTIGTIYYVVSAATDAFSVSTTQGGAAIDLTSDADPRTIVSKIVPETFAGQGQYTLQSLTISQS